MKKQYIAPQTQELQIETMGILMSSFGDPNYIPLTPP
jgi:hypothetical protein